RFDEEAAQVDRLIYVLSNGVKEGLVARVEEWPGVHSAHALLTGEPLEGIWYDRTLPAACGSGARPRSPARSRSHRPWS
ncbi:MAG TPA: hypothetical protein VK899_00705, partial [Gemmatimonadales bacterium]|nr:hypothetical protein [Gemmatimonadales bacterium]